MIKKILFTLLIGGMTSSVLSGIFWPAYLTNHYDILGIGQGGLSGVVYDPQLYRMLYVDDGGHIARSDINGSSQYKVKIGGKNDLEAVATKRRGDAKMYVGVEATTNCGIGAPFGLDACKSTPVVKELYTSNLSETGYKWKLEMDTSKGKGMEGLTWVSNGSHPYGNIPSGGVFFASSQDNGTINVYDLNSDNATSSSSAKVSRIGHFLPDSNNNDIADLYFEPEQNILYVLYDSANKIVLIRPFDPTVFQPLANTYKQIETIFLDNRVGILDRSDEGLTVLPPGCSSPTGVTKVYIADDNTTGIRVYNNFPVFCPNSPDQAEFLEHNVPGILHNRESRVVTFKFKNTGTTTWTAGNYYLELLNKTFATTTSRTAVLTQNVGYMDTATFSFETAVSVANRDLSFQARMRHGNNWFGEFSPVSRVRLDEEVVVPPSCPFCQFD